MSFEAVSDLCMAYIQMIEIDAEGIAMLECHEDPDVFRTRFGKAINFEYHEVRYSTSSLGKFEVSGQS